MSVNQKQKSDLKKKRRYFSSHDEKTQSSLIKRRGRIRLSRTGELQWLTIFVVNGANKLI